MKSKSDIIYKFPLFCSLFALIAAVPLRVYQYFKILEPETGFYNKIDFSVYVIYILLGIAMVIGIAIPLINRKRIITVSQPKKSSVFLVVSIILAVTLIIDSATQLVGYFDLYEQAVSSSAQVTQYVKDQGGNILLIQSVFGAIAAIYFFVTGLAVGIGNSDGTKFKVLAFAPVLWCIFKLLYRFKRTISFVNVSDLLLELFAIVFLMLFFLAFSQVVSAIDASVVYWKLYAYGVPAVTFSLMCFLPRFIVMAVGHSDLLCTHHGISYSDLGVAIYIIFALLSRAKAQTNNSPEQSE